MRRKPELDGIRGIAVLGVLLSHLVGLTGVMPAGLVSRAISHLLIPAWCGVELFFVLSGFLITGILVETKCATNYFKSFYVRRALRIFPIYYLTITVMFLLSGLSPWIYSSLPLPAIPRLSYYLYLQNWPVFWTHGFGQANLLGHFWSLAVEEQFYWLWPIVVLYMSERAILRLCGFGLLLGLPFRIVMVHYWGISWAVMTLTPSRLDGLLIGSACFLLIRQGGIPRWLIQTAAAVSTVLFGYIVIFHSGELIASGRYMHTLGVTAFSLGSGAFLAYSQQGILWLNHLLTRRWLMAFGKYAYGLYVYHLVLFASSSKIAARLGIQFPLPLPWLPIYAVVMIGSAFILAKASFDLFEVRFLALKDRFRPIYEKQSSASPAARMASSIIVPGGTAELSE